MREETEEGEPITNVIEHGINRANHASDCVAVILKEVKSFANQGKCRVLVAVDKANMFYGVTNVEYPDKSKAYVEKVTIARAFRKLFKNDWVLFFSNHIFHFI